MWVAVRPSYNHRTILRRVSSQKKKKNLPCTLCIHLTIYSQPFWGNMVAVAAAGPEPIPQKALTATGLADAIKYCLRPEALTAARNIATTMQNECGVQTAVSSFHHNLPLDKMRCHILSDEPAVWAYKNSLTTPLYFSKTAARLLIDNSKIDPKELCLSVIFSSTSRTCAIG